MKLIFDEHYERIADAVAAERRIKGWYLDSFSFGDTPELANELLALVLQGKKTATAWAASGGLNGVEVQA